MLCRRPGIKLLQGLHIYRFKPEFIVTEGFLVNNLIIQNGKQTSFPIARIDYFCAV